MNTHYHNPAKLILQQLTPQVIKQFDRDQVIRKLGLDEALTPEDRQQCQLTIFLLRERLAVIDENQASILCKSMEQQQAVKERPLLPIITQEQIAAIKHSSLPFVLQQTLAMKWPMLPIIEIPLPPIIPQSMPPILEKPFSDIKQPLKTNKDIIQQNLSSKNNDKCQQEKIHMAQTFSIFGSIGSRPQKLQTKSKQMEYSSTFVEEEEQSASLLSKGDQQDDLNCRTQATECKKKLE